jgi:hypothetical protein
MVAKRIALPSKQVELELVGNRDNLLIPRIQRLTLNADKPSNDIDELGDRLHAGTTEDIPAITVTFQSMDVGTKLFSILTGTDNANYPASGVSVTALDDVDVIVRVRDQSLEKYVKSAHARRCTIRDVAMSYSVDGESTEEYTVIGSKKRWFTNDIQVQKFVAGSTSFALTYTPVALKSGDKCLAVIMDGVYLTEVTGTPATGEYKVTTNTITTFDSRVNQLLAVYQYGTGGTWADVSDATMPAAIRGNDAVVTIAAGNLQRVQSVTINTAFNPETVKEMGNRDIVGYLAQNAAITGTITVLDTDTQLIALLTTGSFTPSGVTEFQISELTVSGISLQITLQDPKSKVLPYTIVKTLFVPQITITSEGFTSNVNANAQQTFDFRSTTGELLIFKGAKTV